jgi:hypothetical protein
MEGLTARGREARAEGSNRTSIEINELSFKNTRRAKIVTPQRVTQYGSDNTVYSKWEEDHKSD